jgi:hypothetical protein
MTGLWEYRCPFEPQGFLGSPAICSDYDSTFADDTVIIPGVFNALCGVNAVR